MTNISVNKEIINISLNNDSTKIHAFRNNIAVIAISTQGPSGSQGEGIPQGGSEGEVLIKTNDENYNVNWANITENIIKPLSVTLTYNSEGNISAINKNGLITNFNYNSNGTVNNIANSKFTKTFTYNTDHTINEIIVS